MNDFSIYYTAGEGIITEAGHCDSLWSHTYCIIILDDNTLPFEICQLKSDFFFQLMRSIEKKGVKRSPEYQLVKKS